MFNVGKLFNFLTNAIIFCILSVDRLGEKLIVTKIR